MVDSGRASVKVLVGTLSQKGFAFRMAAGSDRLVRVMVGPYSDAQSADLGKAALTAAGVQVVREW